MGELALLGLFAHPDDEQLVAGTFAMAALEGIRTGLVCATRGEVGEIADSALATPDNLGQVRERELRAAATVAGIKYLWFLDYRDSGMMGTADNDHPASFYRSEREEALARVVKIVREFRPNVMVTFDETGGYGHPDHLTIHMLATEAFTAASDPQRFTGPAMGEPWQAERLFYTAFPRSHVRRITEFIRKTNLETGFVGIDAERLGIPDEQITNRVDVREWLAVKERSLAHHRTQMNPNSPLARMPRELIETWRSTEHYALAAGKPLPDDPQAKGDIFAGLR